MHWFDIVPYAVKVGAAIVAFILYRMCTKSLPSGKYNCIINTSENFYIKATLVVDEHTYSVLVKGTTYLAQQNGVVLDESDVLQTWRLL